jgi:hypothetical protein
MIAIQKRNELWLEAITQWEKILGQNSVLIKKDEIAPYTKNTIGVTRNIKGILLPCSTAEVQAIVRTAKQFKTPLYPISGGKNWGYGSCNPVANTSFIVDLSRMKKISDFDSDLGVVTVEPGVTQQELYDFFQKHGNLFMVPTTGAGPSASILGNALERGYGLTPHSDHHHTDTPPFSTNSLRRSDPTVPGPSMWNASVSTGMVVRIGSRTALRALTQRSCWPSLGSNRATRGPVSTRIIGGASS